MWGRHAGSVCTAHGRCARWHRVEPGLCSLGHAHRSSQAISPFCLTTCAPLEIMQKRSTDWFLAHLPQLYLPTAQFLSVSIQPATQKPLQIFKTGVVILRITEHRNKKRPNSEVGNNNRKRPPPEAGGTQGRGHVTRAWGPGPLGGTGDHKSPLWWELEPRAGLVAAGNTAALGRGGEK